MKMAVLLDHRLLLIVLSATAEARHPPAATLSTPAYTTSDPTANSRPNVYVYLASQYFDRIFATQRSPTTQLLSFSPDRLQIDLAKFPTFFDDGTDRIPANRSILHFRLQQRACKLSSGSTYDSCYATPFDTGRPDSKDQAFTFFRRGGVGESLNEAAEVNNRKVRQAKGLNGSSSDFWGNEEYDLLCNNHRAVTADKAFPPVYEEYSSTLDFDYFWNDAEHAEEIMGLPAGACRWTPRRSEFLQEVAPLPGQLHPHALGIEGDNSRTAPGTGAYWMSLLGTPGAGARGQWSPLLRSIRSLTSASATDTWDHNIEICAYQGDCDSNTFECINNYRVELLANNVYQPDQLVDVLYYNITQFPQALPR